MTTPTTLHPALIRQPPATYQTSKPNEQTKEAIHEFEMSQPSPHPNMTPTLAPTSPPLPSSSRHSRTSSTASSSSTTSSPNSWGRGAGSAAAAAARSREEEGSVPVHQRGGGKGLCCGICAGLACFECLECCC